MFMWRLVLWMYLKSFGMCICLYFVRVYTIDLHNYGYLCIVFSFKL